MSTDAEAYRTPRRWPRRTFRSRIRLQAVDWPDLDSAQSRDISYGGIGLELSRPVRPGDRFLFQLTAADGSPRLLVAEVRYVTFEGDRCRAGLEWRVHQARDRAALEAFIDAI